MSGCGWMGRMGRSVQENNAMSCILEKYETKLNHRLSSVRCQAGWGEGGAQRGAAPISAGQMETLEHFIVTAHNRNSNKVSNNNNNNKKERERGRGGELQQ